MIAPARIKKPLLGKMGANPLEPGRSLTSSRRLNFKSLVRGALFARQVNAHGVAAQ